MIGTLLARLDGFNRRHPWSHNDYYGAWVARRVRRGGHVLDVGCGTGDLIARLRGKAATVTGFEPDPATAGIAAERFAHDPAIAIERTGFSGRDPHQRWDAITLVAVVHHLPLAATLRELRDCLAPGGRLIIVGCHRAHRRVDLLIDLPAVLANPIIGLIRHPSRAHEQPPHMTAPTADPEETLAEIRAVVARELPGARIRRRLFWRYTLVYDAG